MDKREPPSRQNKPVEIPDKTPPKKVARADPPQTTCTAPAVAEKSNYSQSASHAAVNPMYSMNQGGGGVGIGPTRRLANVWLVCRNDPENHRA